jgi:ATP-binding cassette subfamily B protein
VAPIGKVIVLVLAAILISVLGAFASAAEKLRNAKLREQLGLEVRDRILAHIQGLSFLRISEHKTGELVLRLADDGQKVVRLLTKTTPVLFRYLLTTILAFTALFILSAWIGVFSLLAVLVLGLMVRRYAIPLRGASRAKRSAEGEVSALAQELIRGLPNTQIQGMEKLVSKRFNGKSRISLRAGVHETRIAVSMEKTMQLANGIIIALVIGIGAYLVLMGRLSLGSLTVCVAYITQLLKPVEKINELASSISRGLARGEKLVQLLEDHSGIQDQPSALRLLPPIAKIEIENLTYAYPHEGKTAKTNAALKQINLTLEVGSLTVIVGPSGCGKSTLINLLLRMMDPDAGQIRINNIPYRDVRVSSLRRQFAVMLQRTHLFSGSIRDHFRVPDQRFSTLQIWNVLEQVAMDDFILSLPEALDSEIGEDAVKLSGGQRARLALARCLLMDRPVLLLDEPLANVDPASREIILDALDKYRVGRICVVVTHQMEMAARADRIITLDKGLLVANSLPQNLQPSIASHALAS